MTHTLYRFFAANGDLLYVGRTVDARSRWRSHERSKDWFDDVANVTRTKYATAELLADAEVTAIKTERPIHNVVHNDRPRAPKIIPAEVDSIIANRWWNLSGRPRVVEPIDPCDDPSIESYCDCIACHRLRMDEVDALRDEFSFDPIVGSRIDRFMREYEAGAYVADWICELLDIRIFRPLELAVLSREVGPLPRFAEATERGIRVDCPFCMGEHEHFVTSGHALTTALESPCIYTGFYRVANNDDWIYAQDEYLRFLEKHDKPASAA